MRFFTSDTHFGHKNVIAYCKRPFKDLDDMHDCLVRRWNQVVTSDDDEIYILGDFAFGGKKFIAEILSKLRGKKILVRGNHDWKNVPITRTDLGFEKILDGTQQLFLGSTPVLIGHFPYRAAQPTDLRYEELKPENKGRWLLHGHVHCAWCLKDKMLNVGVDAWNYCPISEKVVTTVIRHVELFGPKAFPIDPKLRLHSPG